MAKEPATILTDPDRPPEDKKKLVTWRNRKAMAWISLYAILIYTFVLWFILPVWYDYATVTQQEWIEQVADSSAWLYSVLGGVIVGDMGTTTWAVKGQGIKVDERDY